MPTFCRADRKPASSPVMSPGSAYAGPATPTAVQTLSAASSVFITHPFSLISESGCPLAQLSVRRHDFRFAAFGQMHRMDAGFLRQLFEQTFKTVLVDRVVLHAFRLLRYLCDQPLQLLRRLLVFEVLQRSQTAANATVGHDGGSPGTDRAAEHPRRGHRTEHACFGDCGCRHGFRPGG